MVQDEGCPRAEIVPIYRAKSLSYYKKLTAIFQVLVPASNDDEPSFQPQPTPDKQFSPPSTSANPETKRKRGRPKSDHNLSRHKGRQGGDDSSAPNGGKRKISETSLADGNNAKKSKVVVMPEPSSFSRAPELDGGSRALLQQIGTTSSSNNGCLKLDFSNALGQFVARHRSNCHIVGFENSLDTKIPHK